MKRFDAELFKQTLMQTPWDSVLIFDKTDDVLDSWEKLFIDGLEQHCPGRTKRVACVNQAPWITPAIIKQLQFRDALLKKFRRHRNPSVWAAYKKARNKAVGMLRNIKRKFYVSKLEQNENDALQYSLFSSTLENCESLCVIQRWGLRGLKQLWTNFCFACSFQSN